MQLMTNFNIKMTTEQLAHLGGGIVAYVREIEGRDAVRMLGPQVKVSPEAKLFCLYNADGSPISISGSREAALNSAIEHELIPASVH